MNAHQPLAVPACANDQSSFGPIKKQGKKLHALPPKFYINLSPHTVWHCPHEFSSFWDAQLEDLSQKQKLIRVEHCCTESKIGHRYLASTVCQVPESIITVRSSWSGMQDFASHRKLTPHILRAAMTVEVLKLDIFHTFRGTLDETLFDETLDSGSRFRTGSVHHLTGTWCKQWDTFIT